MHEFSIAQNIVDIAEDSARRENCRRIISVRLEVGMLSGVVFEALETALEFAVKKTMLEGAQIEIIRVEARAECEDCRHLFFPANHPEPCPRCKSYSHRLLQGDEIRVVSIEAE